MKIAKLEIEGFGVWSDLKVERLSDALNVFYGPNEAGKTTLLQFIRSMLYGFSPQRRRYLPPVHGGRPGGTLDVVGLHGRFQIGRYEADKDGRIGEQLTLTAPDGTRQGEHFVKVILSNVDEPVFNNVFAVGLSEIQELATLSDTEAAELLYSITSGLDRVSLVEVLRELEASRNRVLDASGDPCQITQILRERDKLLAELEELSSINQRYAQASQQWEQLIAEITRLEEETNRLDRLAQVMDLAILVRERWVRRATLDEQLAAAGSLRAMPSQGIERLDAVNKRIQEQQDRLDQIADRRTRLVKEFRELAINESLWRQAARIEAFQEQQPWIVQLQSQIEALEKEIGDLNVELSAESKRLGLEGELSGLGALSSRKLALLRGPGKRLRQCRQRLAESRQAEAAAQEAAELLQKQVDAALAARGERDLAAAMDRTGGLVAQLRRRIQVEERLDQLTRHQTELEERARLLLERQILPLGVLVGLGAAFVVGTVLILAGLFMPASLTGSVGWALALLGVLGSGGAALGKVMLERSHAQQHESCQKQLGGLRAHIEQAKEERNTLDAQLPRGGGPLVSRLQAAEKDLAELEELAPVDTKRRAAAQDADAAQRGVVAARADYKTARRRWQDALAAAGLPPDLAPPQARAIMRRGDRLAEKHRRAAQRREELVQRRREQDALSSRLAQLAADAGVTLQSHDLLDQLRELMEAVDRQQAAVARREAIRREAKRVRAAFTKRQESLGRLKHRHRQLLIEAGVGDEEEFRRRAMENAKIESLRQQREAVSREIQTVLGAQCSEETIQKELEGKRADLFEARREELGRRLTTSKEQLHGLLERRGRLSEQIDALTRDGRLASKQLDLAILQQRLADAVHRWQVLAATSCILEIIRETYERHRQPETLQEASGYLERLTQGRYCRVWTPLGEHSLRVDDAEGHALPIESLSRGTREQLFLSLRLALVSSYARRGAPLPLILDDVLVNFDADRAGAAAAVLRDFAAAGHQLFVFTCHEHILNLFKSLRVPVGRLPRNGERGPMVVALEFLEISQHEEPAHRDRERRPRRKPATKSLRQVQAVEEREQAAPAETPAVRRLEKNRRGANGGAFDADFFDSNDEEALARPGKNEVAKESAEEAVEDSPWEDSEDDDALDEFDDDAVTF